MIDSLDMMMRIWELGVRSERAGQPLDPVERAELLALLRHVERGVDEPPPKPRVPPPLPVPAMLMGDGTAFRVAVRRVNVDHVLVTGLEGPALGARVLLRASNAMTGVEYIIPCVVTRVTRGMPVEWRLAIDGVPERAPLSVTSGPALATRMRGFLLRQASGPTRDAVDSQ